MSEPELYNGDVWRQCEFPCFEVMILMLGRIDGELMFCKVSTRDHESPPLTVTEEDGTWYYTREAMLARLHQLKYTLVGDGRVAVRRGRARGGR